MLNLEPRLAVVCFLQAAIRWVKWTVLVPSGQNCTKNVSDNGGKKVSLVVANCDLSKEVS